MKQKRAKSKAAIKDEAKKQTDDYEKQVGKDGEKNDRQFVALPIN